VVGILALAVIKDRRFLWGLPLLAILLLTVIQRTAQGDVQTFMALIDTTRGGTLPGRMEIWQRALLLIQDFPFSGAGIGTFSPLSNRLYPYFRSINPQIPHPHNMILTMAVDLGIPGLMLYSALLTGFALMIIKTAKKAKAAPRALLIGLGCGMLAHQLFGIMDAFMLGSKLGAVMWIFYGLAAGLYLVTIEPGQDGNQHKALEGVKSWLFDLGTGLVYWLLLSLFALAFVNLNVILSLVLAILGGIALGIILLHRFEQYGN
jgi:putative inorganic carbon (HCO3(-)) transporter